MTHNLAALTFIKYDNSLSLTESNWYGFFFNTNVHSKEKNEESFSNHRPLWQFWIETGMSRKVSKWRYFRFNVRQGPLTVALSVIKSQHDILSSAISAIN